MSRTKTSAQTHKTQQFLVYYIIMQCNAIKS